MRDTEITDKLYAEERAKMEALERHEKAEHECSMLRLDVKNAQCEIVGLKSDIKTANAKVIKG